MPELATFHDLLPSMGGKSLTNNAKYISDYSNLYNNWYDNYGKYDCPNELNEFWLYMMTSAHPIKDNEIDNIFANAPYQYFPKIEMKSRQRLTFGSSNWTDMKDIGNIYIKYLKSCDIKQYLDLNLEYVKTNLLDITIEDDDVLDRILTSKPSSVGINGFWYCAAYIDTLNFTRDYVSIFDQNIYVSTSFNEKQYRGSNTQLKIYKTKNFDTGIRLVNINILKPRTISEYGTVPAPSCIVTLNANEYVFPDTDYFEINVNAPYTDSLIYEYDAIYGRGPIQLQSSYYGSNIKSIKKLIYDYSDGYKTISNPPKINNLKINLKGKLFDKLYFINTVKYKDTTDLAKNINNLDLTVDFDNRTDMDVADFANYDTILSKSIHLKNVPSSLQSQYTADCFDIINVIE